MACRLAFVALLATAALVAGCGGVADQIPESASLAPADAVVFARITTDDDSSQWQKAERVLERIPGVRDTVVSAIEQGLSDEGLDWDADVAPALGDEVVVVATAKLRPIVLLQPDSEEKLVALLAKSDEEIVRGEVEGWVALAEKDTDLADYRAALERGTIEGDEAFAAGLEALPDESLGLVWVDMAVLTDELSPVFQQATQENIDLGIDWLSASLSAEDDGMLVAMGARTPDGGDTHYEPTLFRRVPADAVVAVSFGGTQGTLDRLQGQVDVDGLSQMIEEATGVSLDGVVDALSGEGVLYLRPGRDASRGDPRACAARSGQDVGHGRPPRPQARSGDASNGDDEHRERSRGVQARRRGRHDPVRPAGRRHDRRYRAARMRSRCSPATARSSSTPRAFAGLRRTSDSRIARRASSTSTSTGCCR